MNARRKYTMPVEFTVCFFDEEQAFNNLMKRLNVNRDFVSKGADATAHGLYNETGCRIYAVCMSKDARKRITKRRGAERADAILAHEALHVIQFLFDDIGERHGGFELQNYMLEELCHFLFKKARDK